MDDSIQVYKHHIIVPRKVVTTYRDHSGYEKTLDAYTATMINDHPIESDMVWSLDENFRTFEGTMTIAKFSIDLHIAKLEQFI